jgi:hypothetical protein
LREPIAFPKVVAEYPDVFGGLKLSQIQYLCSKRIVQKPLRKALKFADVLLLYLIGNRWKKHGVVSKRDIYYADLMVQFLVRMLILRPEVTLEELEDMVFLYRPPLKSDRHVIGYLIALVQGVSVHDKYTEFPMRPLFQWVRHMGKWEAIQPTPQVCVRGGTR